MISSRILAVVRKSARSLKPTTTASITRPKWSPRYDPRVAKPCAFSVARQPATSVGRCQPPCSKRHRLSVSNRAWAEAASQTGGVSGKPGSHRRSDWSPVYGISQALRNMSGPAFSPIRRSSDCLLLFPRRIRSDVGGHGGSECRAVDRRSQASGGGTDASVSHLSSEGGVRGTGQAIALVQPLGFGREKAWKCVQGRSWQ